MQQQHLRLLAALLSARHSVLVQSIAGVHEGVAELSGASAIVHGLGCLHWLQQRLLLASVAGEDGRQGDDEEIQEQEDKLKIIGIFFSFFS